MQKPCSAEVLNYRQVTNSLENTFFEAMDRLFRYTQILITLPGSQGYAVCALMAAGRAAQQREPLLLLESGCFQQDVAAACPLENTVYLSSNRLHFLESDWKVTRANWHR